jgi:hypothetical protein
LKSAGRNLENGKELIRGKGGGERRREESKLQVHAKARQ